VDASGRILVSSWITGKTVTITPALPDTATIDAASGFSAGYKSFYFFAYSFVGGIPAAHQLFWLNIYHTVVCLLLSLQYYRLAQAVGLGRRLAFLFVIVNLLTFGNSTFAFFRYYSLASTLFAQLGAVALIRIAVGALKAPGKKARSGQGPLAQQIAPRFLGAAPGIASLISAPFSLLRGSFAAGGLLPLIAFNHVQGLGIAGLGLGAVIIWRLIDWRRLMVFWLATAAIALSVAAVLWWPRHAYVDSVYRLQGWLNAWYGFNMYSWPSPAANRTMQILGLFGLLNLAAGVILVCRNHVVGWLTVGPVIGLSVPFIALPIVNRLAAEDVVAIMAAHRMFFAVPSGLAVVVLTQELSCWLRVRHHRVGSPLQARGADMPSAISGGLVAIAALLPTQIQSWRDRTSPAFALLLMCLGFAMTVPSNWMGFNRTWQVLARTPDDLALHQVWQSIATYASLPGKNSTARIQTMSIPGYLIDIQHAGRPDVDYRHFENTHLNPIYDFTRAMNALGSVDTLKTARFLLFDPAGFYSCYSLAGICSGHWPPQEAALAAAGTPELNTLCGQAGLHAQAIPGGIVFYPADTAKP